MAKKGDYPMLDLLASVCVPLSALFFLAMIASLLLAMTPGAITKHIPLVHRFRSYLHGRLFYYWQLSLEGPLFKVIGACGKRLGRGSLASQCMIPKAFKVKVLKMDEGSLKDEITLAGYVRPDANICEMEVAWTPQPPANPFHVEHYIISYCQVEDDGKVGEWQERTLLDVDYHKKDKEKPKEVGRAARRRLKLAELPAKTNFRVRVCADGPGGRSKWSPEVLAMTFAEPDKKTMGLTGPLAPGAPASVREYQWWQSKHEVGMTLAVPEDWKAKEVSVKVVSRGDTTEFKMQHERGMLLAGTLGGKVKIDEVDWVLEKAPEGGKHIALTLRKEKLMQLWECFIDGHVRVDSSLLKLFHEGNSMNELATADLWE